MVSTMRKTRGSVRKQHAVNYDASIDLVDNNSDDDYVITDEKHKPSTTKYRNSDSESLDDGDDDDDDDDVYAPNRRSRQRKRKTLTKRTRRGKLSSITNKNNTFVSNIDDIENYVENPLFEAMCSEDYLAMETAQSWYEDFTTDDLNTKFEALKDFLNLILRSSGCIVQLSRHDVTNTENAKDTVNELQRMFARQKYHEFPMMYTPVASNNKEWKNYPSNALDFISSIILIAGQTGILYEDDDQFIELLLEWLGAMSTSNVRALRYVSTVFGLDMQNVLCKLSVNLSTFIDKFIRQLRKENDTLRALIEKKGNRQAKRQVESANERIRVIENNVEMYKKQKKIVDNIINDFFNTLFVHRYRDVAPEIRLKCVDYLGEWMDIYPEMFLESSFLRYLGWLLTDQEASIRSEIFKVLTKLYKRRVTVSALRQFTSYFKHKLIEIVIYETDFNARLNCLQLMNEISDKGYLEEDDNIKITSLIFLDNEDQIYPTGSKLNPGKFMKELAKFVSRVEKVMTLEILEHDEITLEELSNKLPFDLQIVVSFNTLLKVIKDSFEYYSINYAKKGHKQREENSKIEKMNIVFQYIYQLRRYNGNNENFELLLNYITYDFTAFDVPTGVLATLELDPKLQLLLLQLIGAASIIYSSPDNQFYKVLIPHTRLKKEDNDGLFFLSKFYTKISDICYYFHDDIAKINTIIHTSIKLIQSKNAGLHALKDTMVQLFRYFSVINFPLARIDKKDTEYFESATYQYIELFKACNIDEFDLVPQVDSVLTESTINLNNKIESKEGILEATNKLYILLHCDFISNKVIKELARITPKYIRSLHSAIATAPSEFDIDTSDVTSLSCVLEIVRKFTNVSLYRIVTHKLDDSAFIFDTINDVQKHLSHSVSFNLPLLQLQMLTTTYLENALTITAFKSEYGSGSELLHKFISRSSVVNILKLICIREYQYAELMGQEDQLERDEKEDINFSSYKVNITEEEEEEEEVKKYHYLYLLCELASKLLLVCKLEIIPEAEENKKVMDRISKNSGVLGTQFQDLLNAVGVVVDIKEQTKKPLKQLKLTDLQNKPKKRKLINNSEGESESESDQGGEDENDPIENSDDEVEGVQDEGAFSEDIDENMEFSDVDGDDIESDSLDSGKFKRQKTNASAHGSLASSFPFTQ